MNIYFKTKKIAKICNENKESVKAVGADSALRLQQRMMELKAADTLNDISTLPPAKCHELSGNRKRQFSVDISKNYRLLFISANEPTPKKADGGLDKSRITEIEIIEIEDTH
jgi:plasmid maintenance system killer protein